MEQIRIPFDRSFRSATPDATWNIVLFLFTKHLQGHEVTKSSLALSSQIPFPSAMRKIHQLIADGDVDQLPKTPTGRATILVPSQRLKADFKQYALSVKALLSDMWSQAAGSAGPEDYYFGAEHLTGPTAPPLRVVSNGRSAHTDLRFLLHKDSYFASMRNFFPTSEANSLQNAISRCFRHPTFTMRSSRETTASLLGMTSSHLILRGLEKPSNVT